MASPTSKFSSRPTPIPGTESTFPVSCWSALRRSKVKLEIPTSKFQSNLNLQTPNADLRSFSPSHWIGERPGGGYAATSELISARTLGSSPRTVDTVGMKLGIPSVVSRNWLVFRRKEFSFPARRERRAYTSAVCEERATKREAKRTAARRVAPKTAWGFVAPRSQSAAAMLPRRALPQAVLGATKHQPIARHHTRRSTNRQPAMPPPSSVHGRHLSFFPQALGP